MRVGDAMTRLIPPGSYILFLFFLAGIWLLISPFIMSSQPSGVHWTASTINNITIGGVMIIVSLLGILGYMGFALRDLIRESQAKQEADSMTLPANQ